jgi:hypothetical protein
MDFIQVGYIPVETAIAETFYILKEDGDAILLETGDYL